MRADTLLGQTGAHEATQMVPAQVTLTRGIDAGKETAGAQFKATLSQKVMLKNGPALPAGTTLTGVIGQDDMNVTGSSRLVLRSNQAVRKDGQNVPIKATIVGIYAQKSDSGGGDPLTAGGEVPNDWHQGKLKVDQIGVIPGVDLHSSIASQNSRVLVSVKKDVKIPGGSQMELVIAERTNSDQEISR